ncbi:MAG: TonB family protein [Thermomonas sp.]|uniref:energy transducer TonB n=1 Tax=Thermomonas sp. TaxID=1971895 RepID=UPI00261C12FA|nr:TonB family protein [Thermomonas sp.]MCC7097864.1 TonB family protein [Thermomonas sp.]
MTEPDAPPAVTNRWSLPRLLALAFAAGLLLFVLVWLSSRHDYDFYTPTDAATAQDPNATLPAPIAPDLASGGASGLQVDPNASTTPPSAQPPSLDEHVPQPIAQPVPTPSTTAPVASNSDRPDPLPLATRPPRYPPEEMRRGLGGTVRVRVHVAADGSVQDSEIETSSGNRNLDRAALDATRRWTFQPAIRNGQSVASTVVVPIDFKL